MMMIVSHDDDTEIYRILHITIDQEYLVFHYLQLYT